MIVILIYWLTTTIYGTYWLIKHPSDRMYEDDKYVSLLEIIGKFVFASVLAWCMVPMMLLATIKFKR